MLALYVTSTLQRAAAAAESDSSSSSNDDDDDSEDDTPIDPHIAARRKSQRRHTPTASVSTTETPASRHGRHRQHCPDAAL